MYQVILIKKYQTDLKLINWKILLYDAGRKQVETIAC